MPGDNVAHTHTQTCAELRATAPPAARVEKHSLCWSKKLLSEKKSHILLL